jgi:hypothetical protein
MVSSSAAKHVWPKIERFFHESELRGFAGPKAVVESASRA